MGFSFIQRRVSLCKCPWRSNRQGDQKLYSVILIQRLGHHSFLSGIQVPYLSITHDAVFMEELKGHLEARLDVKGLLHLWRV